MQNVGGGHLWYKDAVIYELHVRAFYDSNGDGIGDFPGLTQRLDYLQELGVTAIWLLPFYPSPLLDDGYDTADYMGIHPSYGTLDDFRAFVAAAHEREIRVITELVLNHTSDQHPWFQRARRAAPGSPERDFYVWSETPEKYSDARIIFQDYETSNWSWDAVAGAYYWHRFFSHQPDLNFTSPHVRRAILEVVDFWLGMGVDGLRLDAVPYLFERENTTSENLPETHHALKKLRAHIDAHHADRMLLAEANQWPEEAVAYFGDGDECHMAFHFPVMPRLFLGVRLEDSFPIIDILEQTPALPEACQWATFLRNHDELTLEMVAEEERIFMYRSYARQPEARINLGIRRRLAPLLNGLLFSLPGTPVIYYGDEIGMGDNVYLGDRNGVRTPMQWNADRNAGFSTANPQRLYLPLITDHEYHHEFLHIEAQQANSSSLLRWMQRLIGVRKRYPAFGRGSLEFLSSSNDGVLAFMRSYEDQHLLVVANLSRFAQHTELELDACAGLVPVEVIGHKPFPPIGEQPYLMTLGPHEFFWFELVPAEALAPTPAAEHDPAIVTVKYSWMEALEGSAAAALMETLPSYLCRQTWFRHGSGALLKTEILDTVPLVSCECAIALVRVNYTRMEPQMLHLPLAFAEGERAAAIAAEHPQALIARLAYQDGREAGVLYDALLDPAFATALLRSITGGAPHWNDTRLTAHQITEPNADLEHLPEPEVAQREHNNSTAIFGERALLKLFRTIDEGLNPDLEISMFLRQQGFPHVPEMLGALEYQRGDGPPISLALAQAYVPHRASGWEHTQAVLEALLRRGSHPALRMAGPLLERAAQELPPEVREWVGPYMGWVELLGRRTAQMHRALGADEQHPAFAPQPFTPFYQRSVYQSQRSLTGRTLRALRAGLERLDNEGQQAARQLLQRRDELLRRFLTVTQLPVKAQRLRFHGDYHLGQVLVTERDIVMFDFEGEPDRPVTERQLKRSPLRDVASMLASFQHAAHIAAQHRRDAVTALQVWLAAVSAGFLRAYLEETAQDGFLPEEPEARAALLDGLILEKATYDLGYALAHHPELVPPRIRALLALLDQRPS